MQKWLARSSMFAFLIVICSFSTALAQDQVSVLSQYLDQSAASNNLPTGDGNISPVERSVASALIDSVTGYDQTVTEFANSSPDNAAWITQAQQNLTNYNQQMAANANAPVDVRAQIISDAVAQYGQDVETVTVQGTWDPRAQIISDAVAQYGQDIETVQPPGKFDPRAQAISDAVAQYGKDIEPVTSQAPFDPRAQAISDAVAQYGKEVENNNGQSGLSQQEKQSIKKIVKDTSNHYVDSTDSEYKELIKQHLQRLIDNELEDLPIDWVWPEEGLWVRKFVSSSSSGCSNGDGGDNGGPDRDYPDSDPSQQAQLCMSAVAGLVILDGKTFRWDRSGQPNTYITETSFYGDGESTQSVLSVVDDYNIDVVTTNTSGTCSSTSVIHYTLYAPGRMFGCSVNPEVHSVDDEMDQENPNDSNQDSEEPIVEPIKSGEYSVWWLPFDSSCAASVKPTFDQMTITPTSFDDVKLIINGETFRVSGEGMRGEFNAYENNLYITLNRRFMDDFNLIWQTSNDDQSESCYAQGIVNLETAATSQPNYQPPAQNNSSGDLNTGNISSDSGSNGSVSAPTAAPPEGDYSITWSPVPGIECPADLQDKLPNFTQAMVSNTADDHFILNTSTDSYMIELIPGASQWMFTKFNGDNSGVVIALSAVSGNTFTGTFTYFTPDSQMCFMNIEGHSRL
jgi:hypothetical protein